MSGGMDHDRQTCDCEEHQAPKLLPRLNEATPGQLFRAACDSLERVALAFADDDGETCCRPRADDMRLEMIEHDREHKRVTLFIDVENGHSVSDDELRAAEPKLKALGIDDVVREQAPDSWAITDW